jgi:predicted dehydrogenase
MKEYRIGIIGCGYWGPNLIRNFFEMSCTEVVAVADLRQERLNAIHNSYPKIQVTKDYKELFNMDLDAIVIATPPKTHYKIANECLEHGLHVMVEKPLTLSSADSRALCNLAEQKELTLMVGHTFVFNPAVQILKQMIESGELGKIYYIDTARLNLGLFQNGLNVIWDLAPHDISILLYLLGVDPITISAQGDSFIIDGVHDVVYMNMEFPGKIMAHVHISWLDPCKVRRVTVVGSKKMAVYNDLESVEKIKIYDKGVDAPQYTNSFDDFQCSYRYGDILIPNIRLSEPLRLECQHFIESIDEHHKPRSSGEEGLRVVRILEAAQQSLVNNAVEVQYA